MKRVRGLNVEKRVRVVIDESTRVKHAMKWALTLLHVVSPPAEMRMHGSGLDDQFLTRLFLNFKLIFLFFNFKILNRTNQELAIKSPILISPSPPHSHNRDDYGPNLVNSLGSLYKACKPEVIMQVSFFFSFFFFIFPF